VKQNVLLVGTVSNVSQSFLSDFRTVYGALSLLFNVEIFLVESDSSDNTVEILRQSSVQFDGFNFESLGDLRLLIPERIERIRYCRNLYVNYIRRHKGFKDWRYIVVADLDGMNSRLNTQAIDSCFVSSDWDVCLSNQSGGYYDVLALRHPTWQPNNFLLELTRQREMNVGFPTWLKYFPIRVQKFLEDDFRKQTLVYSKMKKISKKSPWIEVESGFGGFAIYKTHLFHVTDYSRKYEDSIDCEHVDFHLKARELGARIFINPRLVNSRWNTYNMNRFFVIRQIRRLIWLSPTIYRISKLLKSMIRIGQVK
jgi:hypothetical protein